MDVALATCKRLPEPDHDEAPLLAALAARGIDARMLAWDDPGADFSSARITLLRSTWNYYRDVEAFLAWAEATARVSELINGIDVVRWNHDKRYLSELASQGIRIAPTERVARGETRSVEAILDARGWDDVVIKPTISAASFRTMRARRGHLDDAETHLRDLTSERDAFVQRYLPSVESHGERAIIWIDGELTHAVRKTPRFGDEAERVSGAVPIGPAEGALAREAVAAVPYPLTYARVDVARGLDGEPVVMELELMEPSLYFPQSTAALERFVAAVTHRLSM